MKELIQVSMDRGLIDINIEDLIEETQERVPKSNVPTWYFFWQDFLPQLTLVPHSRHLIEF